MKVEENNKSEIKINKKKLYKKASAENADRELSNVETRALTFILTLNINI